MSTPVRDEQPPAPPEELVLGPQRGRTVPRWVPTVALLLGVLILAGAAAWRFWPRPIEPLSLTDLQDTYEGMVRSDGTNDASVLTRQSVRETSVTVDPAVCAPLVEATLANRIPDTARDGVGTYWIGQSSTISLFTLRFDDTEAADAEHERVVTALETCVDRQMVVRRGEASSGSWRATVGRTSTGSTGVDEQVGYLLNGPDGLVAIQLLPYLNTITWQYRYETGSTSYSTLAADQLMGSLQAQLDAVVAARPQ